MAGEKRMAVELDPALPRHEEGGEDEGDAPAHHPVAPPDDLFDLSTTVDPSYIISLIRKLVPTSGIDNVGHDHKSATDDPKVMQVLHSDDKQESSRSDSGMTVKGREIDGRGGVPAGEAVWEEYGCILWDLSATRTHAELLVQNLVLDVLVANLIVSQSDRVTEICLGIIGNIACHNGLMERLVSTAGLIQSVIDQLFSDDTQCLSEACRLLTLCLQGNECITWGKSLQPAHIILRLVWIVENTLNPVLLEKSVGLLLVILESETGAAPLLLPPLIELGLPKLLVSLLDYEMGKLTSERAPERLPVLDVILRAIEALSTMEDHSQDISSNELLIQLLCNLVKLQDKTEISESCVTVAVLHANILTDQPDLAIVMSQDAPFLQGLFDILPFTSNDVEARNALWSTISRLLVQIKETEMEVSQLRQYILILTCKFDVIEEDLLDHQMDRSDMHENSETRGPGTRSDLTITALRRIAGILKDWMDSKDNPGEKDEADEHHVDKAAVMRLLRLCDKYTM